MKGKERLYAVIGGLCWQRCLTPMVCSLLPVGAQSQANFGGEITCTGLKVVDSEGRLRVWLSPGSFMGGNVFVYGRGR